jgi:outer membrane protein assembly factor BamB
VTATKILSAMLALGLLASCGNQDVILQGDRLDIRDGMAGGVATAANRAVPISLPVAQVNAEWTHRGGGPAHQIGHPALSGGLVPLFAVDIGAGNGRRVRITADPVIAGGRVFTLDSQAQVQATSTGGAVLWRADLTPPADDPSDGSGGGIATDGATVYVTTGFGRVTALDAATGVVRWVQALEAAGTSAPTVANGVVHVVSRDSRAWAIEAGNGRVRWVFSGIPAIAGFAGGAGAAIAPGSVIFPFPSGEVVSVFSEGGLERWSTIVAGARLGAAAGRATTDIGGDPVVLGGVVYVGNVSGRIVALDVATGERLWTATEGATGGIWPVGGSLFAVNDVNALVRFDASTGEAIWRVDLPAATEGNFLMRPTRFAHYGPIVAGGRVIVASSDGLMRLFDPVSGALTGQVEVPGGAASAPVVAGGVLYVVDADGTLRAFR